LHEHQFAVADIHFFILPLSKATRLGIRPICFKTRITAVQITASNRCQLKGLDVVPVCRGAYLNSKVKEVQVPGRARNNILVHDRHADRGEAVGQNGGTGIVLELRQYARTAISLLLGRLQQEALPLTGLLLIYPPHLDILVLLVRHCGFVVGSRRVIREARGWLSHTIRQGSLFSEEVCSYTRRGFELVTNRGDNRDGRPHQQT
jgi:hypothetical protein